MGKTLHVSEDVWVELTKLKLELRARSMDEVLRRLLEVWKQLRR
jgi:predicted CopG family antitoxin